MTRTQRMATLTRHYDTISHALCLLWFGGWALVALKLTGMVGWPWWLVLAPFWSPYAVVGSYSLSNLCAGQRLRWR